MIAINSDYHKHKKASTLNGANCVLITKVQYIELERMKEQVLLWMYRGFWLLRLLTSKDFVDVLELFLAFFGGAYLREVRGACGR